MASDERTIAAPDPVVVKAQSLKTPQDWHNALRSADSNTVIMDGMHDHGLMSDHLVVTKGVTDKKLTPEQIGNIMDSPQPPVLNQTWAAQIAHHVLSGLGNMIAPPAQAGEVVPFRRQSIEPGMGLTEGARAYPGGANPAGEVVPLSPQPKSAMTGQDKYDAAVAKQQWDVGSPKFGGLADRWANFAKNDPKNAAVWEKEFHYALDKASPEKKPLIYMQIGKALDTYGY